MSLTESRQAASLPTQQVESLRREFRGDLLQLGDDGYEAARAIWNGMIDRRPDLIARCTGVADVRAALNFARENQLLIAVRAGGHNWAGLAVAEGGILIDLSGMKGILVDPDAAVARVQAGATWADLDHESQAFGLAVTGGHVSTTGVAGLTLGGGIGWLCRKYGCTVDSLISVDIVTADGSFLRASRDENADLFWGVRGGGGNFGIVTSFTFRLHPVDQVVGGLAFWPGDSALDVLRFYREFLEDIPNELTTVAAMLVGPPAPFLPPELHGKLLVAIGACYAGDIDEGMRVVEGIKKFGPPAADLIGPMPYKAHQTLLDPILPPHLRYYVKSVYLDELSDEAIETFVRRSAAMTSPLTLTTLQHYRGAVSEVEPAETAYSYRNAAFGVTIGAAWTEPSEDERHVRWSREFYEAILPVSHGVYVNFMGLEEGEERVRAAYGSETYEKLVSLKDKYDPTNLFRVNHNIRPTRREGV